MDDNKKSSPIDSDSALVSDDPQAQVAGQGWNYIDPLGKAYGALKEGQQNAKQFDKDLSGSVQSMKDLARTGVASNPEADLALAAHTNGMAMGTLKSEGKSKPQATYGKTTPDLTHMEMKSPHIDHSTQRRLHTEYAQTAEANGDLELAEKHNKMARMHDYYDTAQYFGPDAYRKRENYGDVKEGRKLYVDKAKALYDELNAKPKPLPMDEGKAPKFKNAHDLDNGMLEVVDPKNSKTNAAGQFGLGDDQLALFADKEDHGIPFKNAAQLEHIHVDDSARGQGIGTHLYNQFEKEALKQKADGIVLNASPMGSDYSPEATERLVKFYKRLGFEEYGPREKSNQLMTKSLSKTKKSGKLSYADGGQVQHYAEGTPIGGAQVQGVAPLDNAAEAPPPGFEAGPQSTPIDQSAPPPPPGFLEGVASELKEEKYGTGEQKLKSYVEGGAQGLLSAAAPYIEKHVFGVKDEDIRGRAEVNGPEHFLGEVTGLLGPTILSGGASAAGKLGLTGVAKGLTAASGLNQATALEAVGSKLAAKLAPTTLAGKIGTGAAKAAVENMLLSGGDEASKMIINDPAQSAQHAIASVALSGLLGGAIGGTMSGMGALFDPKIGGKLGQAAADFKAEIKSNIETPDPVKTMHEELSSNLAEASKVFDDTFGAQGIKADAIAKLVPKEITPEIVDQFSTISDKLDSSLKKLVEKGDPHASLLEDKIAKFKQSANSQDTATMFNSLQDLKQELQSESRYTEGLSPLSERAYRSTVKTLAHDLRTSLEESKVWGDAAHVQAEINSAASKYFPAIKDFKSLMTTKVMGESQVDPGKIQTYLNQLGKANAEIKQTKVRNFVDNMDMFKAAVNKTYERLGLESPIQPTSMNYTLSTLGEKTTGSKLAQLFIKKGLTDAGGKGMGALVGGFLGHSLGISPEISALIGSHALGSFFSSTMPALAKAILKLPESGVGLRAATNYTTAVAKGYQLTQQATKNVFRLGSEVLPQSYMPTDRDRTKLQKAIDKFTTDPNKLLSAENKVGHYLPDHSGAISKTTMNAINYLNSLKPPTVQKSPLDPKPVLSSTAQAKYDNALNIAEQPLFVLHKIQKGTLNHNDVEALSAIYPEYYAGMKQNLMTQIADLKAKGKAIPYNTQNVLSLFMGQPMNSTTTPAAIQSMQASSNSNKQQAQQPAAPKRSTASLNKLPGMYQTPGQKAEGREAK